MENQNFKCKFCGKICKNPNSLRNHERLCIKNPNRDKHSLEILQKGREKRYKTLKSWNKGFTKETDERIMKSSQTLQKTLQSKNFTPYWKGKKHTPQTREKISKSLQESKKKGKNIGGYGVHKSGYGKKCLMGGVFFDSSWEVAYYIYNKEHNVLLERNFKGFPYKYRNKEHLYIPDFYDGENYIEIKGYEDSKCKYKYKSIKNLKIIYDVSKEIEYMNDKYGEDWLYKVCEKVFN